MGIICSNMKHLGKIPRKVDLHCTQQKKKRQQHQNLRPVKIHYTL